MKDLEEKYHEHLLHWIWQTLHFDAGNLETTCGQPVTILEPGRLNSSGGPDFKEARLQIGDLRWHGDIEFHWSVADWRRHGHQHDPGYNQVILHVVYQNPDGKRTYRQDGSAPFLLHLRPHLPENLEELLAAFRQPDRLPCAGQLRYISREALEQQFRKAHREYFETKADALLNFYDPDLAPATAWKKVFSLGLFDGLGISLNREPMLRVGRRLYNHVLQEETFPAVEELQFLALQFGGFGSARSAARWSYKGVRPANRPKIRLQQAATLMGTIHHEPLDAWFKGTPSDRWERLLNTVDTETGIGRQRSDILYGIVYLPALWLLGTLFHIDRLKQRAFELWMNHRAQVPSTLFKLFAQSDFPPDLYKQRLGAVFQLKQYCKPRRCSQCKVLKEIISS
ncbi:DUF2851 family protein [Halalkalibaculum sp. DA3122]|uniref:DUF2851 family protein n=1 Tax=Halalkalibaculum sp. DA3122 TaxID=3373607 RepID=UPI003753FD61